MLQSLDSDVGQLLSDASRQRWFGRSVASDGLCVTQP
jgi:hypothetical protein